MIHGAAQHGARTDDDVHIHNDALQIGALADGAAPSFTLRNRTELAAEPSSTQPSATTQSSISECSP